MARVVCWSALFCLVVVSSYGAVCLDNHLQVTTAAIKKEDLVTADDVAAPKGEQVVEEEEQEQAGEIEKEGEAGVSARRRVRRET